MASNRLTETGREARLRHRIQCLQGSHEARDPNSALSRKIILLQGQLVAMKKRLPGKNNCLGGSSVRLPKVDG